LAELTYEAWKRAAGAASPTGTAWIGGQAREASGNKTFSTINPATGEHIAEVAACDRVEVDAAVEAARGVFEEGLWAQAGPEARKQVMQRIATLITKHADELALLDSLEVGKCITEALDDVAEAAKLFHWFGELQDKVYDEVAPSEKGQLATITHEPVGVVGAIVAWNYPLHNASVKLAPALAAGNSVILKPAEDAPLSSIRLAELCTEAGLPPGVLNVVPGYGETAGYALGTHDDVDAIGFTGSTEVGKALLRGAGESNMKQVWLECGGKSPNIVFDDCADLDAVADAALASIFTNAGQVCSAHSRLLVQDDIKDVLIEKLVNKTASWRPGDPLDPQTTIGAIVNEAQHRKILDYIAEGTRRDRLLCGGNACTVDGTGLFIEPTIFECTHPGHRIAREEIFGPVLTVFPFDTEDQALRLANDSVYGLAASLWTRSLKRAHRMTCRLHAGTVTVNAVDMVTPQTPFGGVKQSGFGRDYSIDGMRKYMVQKTSWICY